MMGLIDSTPVWMSFGTEIELPGAFLKQYSFPVPDLAVRILGEASTKKLDILHQIDDIFTLAPYEHELYDDT